jgi:hypothetical protein
VNVQRTTIGAAAAVACTQVDTSVLVVRRILFKKGPPDVPRSGMNLAALMKKILSGLTLTLAAVGFVITTSMSARAEEPAKQQVHLEADEPGVSFKLKTAEFGAAGYGLSFGVYAPLCTAPCTALIPEGNHSIALAMGGRAPVDGGDVSITGPSTIRGEYESKSALRTAGWVTLLGGPVLFMGGGMGLGFALGTKSCVNDPTTGGPVCSTAPSIGPILAGFGLALASAVTGLVLVLQRDSATVSVTPVAGGGVFSLLRSL